VSRKYLGPFLEESPDFEDKIERGERKNSPLFGLNLCSDLKNPKTQVVFA
jgi:hypothetical protein